MPRSRARQLLAGLAVPKWHELGVRHEDTSGYTLHCKDVHYLDKLQLLSLPAHDPQVVSDLRYLLRWTEDPRLYEPAKSDKLERARMKPTDIAQQLANGKLRIQTNPLGTCKAFRVPEHAKRRWRAIQHPILANLRTAGDYKVSFTSIPARHGAILRGRWCIDLDWSAFFDQFELSEEVSRYFSFIARDGRVYSMRVLPMGLKHSVSIAHMATMQLLNFNPASHTEAYIDNVRLLHDDRTRVIHDAAKLLCRCHTARVTVNELRDKDKGDRMHLLDGLDEAAKFAKAVELVTPMCRQSSDWLGETYDYETKELSVSERTLRKVDECLNAKRPSFRTFAASVGILQYASRTLDLPLSAYYPARRAISAVSALLQDRDDLWDAAMPPLCPDVVHCLQRWRDDILAAPPRTVHAEQDPDLVIVVDASDYGLGALAIDDLNREQHFAQKWSLSDQRAFDTGVSTRSEPEGIFRACCRFVRRSHHRRVFIWSDSQASVHAYNKGHSLAYWMNHCIDRLRKTFPEVTFVVAHVPGKDNPADAISRGATEPTPEQWDQARKLSDEARATQMMG